MQTPLLFCHCIIHLRLITPYLLLFYIILTLCICSCTCTCLLYTHMHMYATQSCSRSSSQLSFKGVGDPPQPGQLLSRKSSDGGRDRGGDSPLSLLRPNRSSSKLLVRPLLVGVGDADSESRAPALPLGSTRGSSVLSSPGSGGTSSPFSPSPVAQSPSMGAAGRFSRGGLPRLFQSQDSGITSPSPSGGGGGEAGTEALLASLVRRGESWSGGARAAPGETQGPTSGGGSESVSAGLGRPGSRLRATPGYLSRLVNMMHVDIIVMTLYKGLTWLS